MFHQHRFVTLTMDDQNLRSIFAEVFNLDSQAIRDELSPDTVDAWDSFGHMRLITAIERSLNIRLTMDEVVSVDSYGTLRRVVADASGR